MDKRETQTDRTWGYQELALSYFPRSTPDSASVQLRRWIRYSPELVRQLESCGWRAGQKILTPRQVDCIIRHLGAP
ncbi:MAG: DUF4248 domain-containing protein [Tannerellaceae bacterium]|nr:DUF4248 domain-containing protein [Tannerellaceae bacterium]